jgi:hypothetical protein
MVITPLMGHSSVSPAVTGHGHGRGLRCLSPHLAGDVQFDQVWPLVLKSDAEVALPSDAGERAMIIRWNSHGRAKGGIVIVKSGKYIAATAAELDAGTVADKVAGGVSQKVLFRRHGEIEFDGDTLTLRSWSDGGDLRLASGDVTAVRREFTTRYGRFIGGLLDKGKPLILETATDGEIYLLIDRKEFMETTDNKSWEKELAAWSGRA